MTRFASIFATLFFMTLQSAHAQEVPEGRAFYMQYCAQCHGEGLQGGDAQSLVDGVWQFGAADRHIERNIKNGITDLGMPAFANTLTDKQIESIVEFLKDVEGEAGVERPPVPEKIQTMDYDVKVEIVAQGLEVPWAIDFIDAHTALVTERPGRLRVIKNGRLLSEPVADTPEVLDQRQGGLLDVAIDPDHKTNGWIYLSYSHALTPDVSDERPPAMTRVIRGRIIDNAWTDQQVIYEAPHDTYRTSRNHYGSRIVFDPRGYLYFSIGDRGRGSHAQDLSRPNGKIHRIHADGRIPDDNPFVDTEGALPTIYSYGHRNPQGLAVHPETGQVWGTEHGPMGGDELNLIQAGRNYGWPEISYGRNYDGSILTELTHKPGMEQPSFYWKPSVAVCGLDFYSGALFPRWANRLLVGALKYEEVRLLNIEADRVMHEQIVLKNFGRVRDVTTGPEGGVYVVLNDPHAVIRLTPIADRLKQ